MKEYLCDICGKVISGDHVIIKTKRGSELHMHEACVRSESHKEVKSERDC